MLLPPLLILILPSPLLTEAQPSKRAPLFVGLHHRAPSHLIKRQAPTSTGHEALTGLLETRFLALELAVGTPPQNLFINLGLDETPSDRFLTRCKEEGCNRPELANTTVFEEDRSSTFQTSHEDLSYAAGQGEPCIYEEDEPALHRAILTGAAGRVSLGMNGDKAALGGEPFYRAIARHWPEAEFGLWVGKMNLAGPPVSSSNAGELALGGLNPALYSGAVVYYDTVGAGWALPLAGVKVGERALPTFSAPDSANSSAPLVAFSFNAYVVPCDTNTTLTLNVGRHELALPPSAWKYTLPGGCAAFFAPITDTHRATYGYDEHTQIVLGLNALQTVYTAFKVGQAGEGAKIGFAQLSAAALELQPNATVIPGASANPAVTATGLREGVRPGVPATSAAGAGSSSPAAVAGAERVVLGVGGVIGAAALAMVVV